MCRKSIVRFLIAAGVFGALAGNLVAKAAETSPREAGLVPKPVKVDMGARSFHLSPQCQILFQRGSAGAKATAEYLADTWRRGMGFPFPVLEAGELKDGSILLTAAGAEDALAKEGYRLDVTPQGVVIRAPQTAGLFYGVQTLRQLLPAETFGPTRIVGNDACVIPCVRVEDYPRFEWRGMHLDVSRHFFDVQFVQRYLDHLARHKINVFHWHLTDDD